VVGAFAAAFFGGFLFEVAKIGCHFPSTPLMFKVSFGNGVMFLFCG